MHLVLKNPFPDQHPRSPEKNAPPPKTHHPQPFSDDYLLQHAENMSPFFGQATAMVGKLTTFFCSSQLFFQRWKLFCGGGPAGGFGTKAELSMGAWEVGHLRKVAALRVFCLYVVSSKAQTTRSFQKKLAFCGFEVGL